MLTLTFIGGNVDYFNRPVFGEPPCFGGRIVALPVPSVRFAAWIRSRGCATGAAPHSRTVTIAFVGGTGECSQL